MRSWSIWNPRLIWRSREIPGSRNISANDRVVGNARVDQEWSTKLLSLQVNCGGSKREGSGAVGSVDRGSSLCRLCSVNVVGVDLAQVTARVNEDVVDRLAVDSSWVHVQVSFVALRRTTSSGNHPYPF